MSIFSSYNILFSRPQHFQKSGTKKFPINLKTFFTVHIYSKYAFGCWFNETITGEFYFLVQKNNINLFVFNSSFRTCGFDMIHNRERAIY